MSTMSSDLNLLMDMGFTQQESENALQATGNQGVEIAAEWLLGQPRTIPDVAEREPPKESVGETDQQKIKVESAQYDPRGIQFSRDSEASTDTEPFIKAPTNAMKQEALKLEKEWKKQRELEEKTRDQINADIQRAQDLEEEQKRKGYLRMPPYKSDRADVFQFAANVLEKLDIKNYAHPSISISNPGENLVMRPLSLNDYNKGYLDLLSQLGRVGHVSEEKFTEIFHEIRICRDRCFIIVIEDLTRNLVVATATLLIERKFLYSAGLRGRLEDFVVSEEYCGLQLDKLMVMTICALAEHLGCYKLTLDCKDEMLNFYSQFRFFLENDNSNMMAINFK